MNNLINELHHKDRKIGTNFTNLNTMLWKASGCPFFTYLTFNFSSCIMVAKSALACSNRDFICLRSWTSCTWSLEDLREMWLWWACNLPTEIDFTIKSNLFWLEHIFFCMTYWYDYVPKCNSNHVNHEADRTFEVFLLLLTLKLLDIE